MAEVMASAIVLPEEARDAAPDTNGNALKRRQSEVDDQEQESKRQRTSPGKSSPAAPTTEASHKDEKQPPETETSTAKEQEGRDVRKKNVVGDEKQRSKRLFGALLGNLNRPSDRTATKRAEIEQRRKAELKKQDDERLEDKQKRLEQLATHWKKEQVKVDEQNMHIRHKNLLSNANYLQTQAEPKLYYKPWELLPDEEDRIEDQIRDAEKQIDKELDEWDIEKRRRLNEIEGRSEDDDKPNNSKPSGDGEEDGPEQAEKPSNGDTNHEDKIESADTDDSTKPAEAPESDLDLRESSQIQEPPEKEKEEEDEKSVPSTDVAEPSVTAAKAETEEPKDEHDYDGDHVVEGDEDTVIY